MFSETKKTSLLRQWLGTVAKTKLEHDMATHRSDLRDVPITVDPSVGCEQVSGGINKIEHRLGRYRLFWALSQSQSMVRVQRLPGAAQ